VGRQTRVGVVCYTEMSHGYRKLRYHALSQNKNLKNEINELIASCRNFFAMFSHARNPHKTIEFCSLRKL